MKLTVILLFGSLMAMSAATYSQNTKLNLSAKNSSLIDIFRQIEDQSEFYFYFKKEDVKSKEAVSVELKDVLLAEVLDQVLDKTGLEYKIIDRYVVVKEKGDADPAMVMQQERKVSGKVTDSSGSPVTGATVVVKGTTTGVTTDNDGKFSFTLPLDAKVLVFSFVGMKTQEVAISGNNSFEVVLIQDIIDLDEVVTVGYGTQKRANLTGAVSTIGAFELTKRPVTDVGNLLQGKIAGLQITVPSAKPGNAAKEADVIRIRGTGTFSSAGSNPLVLINGVTGDLTNLDPDNIETITVLKDAASSAIYGARAANGVILVTTKKGKSEALTIEYHANVQSHKATRLPKLLTNSADYMMYWNQGRIRADQTPYFTQNEIDAYRNSNDPVKYPNYDWFKATYGNSALVQNHHVSINGGNEKATFNLALGYLDQPGITSASTNRFKKYSFLLSADLKVKDWITIGSNIQMVKKDILTTNMDDSGNDNFALILIDQGPLYTPTMTLPDGSTGYVARYGGSVGEFTDPNPETMAASGSFRSNAYNIVSQVYSDVKLSNNLTWNTKGSINLDYYFGKFHGFPISQYFFKDGSYAGNGTSTTWGNGTGVNDNYNQNLMATLYSTLNYQKVFNEKHNVDVLAGYNQEYNNYRALGGSKLTFPVTTIKELNAGSALGQTTSGTSNEWAIQSFFGRFAYNYKGKYLFEADARYDGTSRIAPKTRWGFFPSASAAWRLSEEPFIKKYSWLDNLKLRGSWGQLGNQNVGLYPYQEILSTTSYAFNALAPGAQMTRLVDKELQWETTTLTDFGLDLNVKNGLLSAKIDWYNKITDNILYQMPVPASVGLSAPTTNYGKMQNTGWEFELGHSQQIGEFRYNVNFNLSTNKNEVLKIKSPSLGNRIIQEGLPFNSFYLIEWIGILQTQAEIDNGPKYPYNPKPGDLKLKDANNDGFINAKDRVVIPGAYPKFFYGGSINLSWRNFDLSAFFQGVEGLKYFTDLQSNSGTRNFWRGASPSLAFIRDMWTPTNPTNKQPAMYVSGYSGVDGLSTTYYMTDNSYLRLKNLSIGYNMPKSFSRKIGLKDIRVYLSGDNLLTFSKVAQGDPERNTGSDRFGVYPQVRIYTLGIKVKL